MAAQRHAWGRDTQLTRTVPVQPGFLTEAYFSVISFLLPTRQNPDLLARTLSVECTYAQYANFVPNLMSLSFIERFSHIYHKRRISVI